MYVCEKERGRGRRGETVDLAVNYSSSLIGKKIHRYI